MADITIAEVREKYPDYNDLSDEQLADKLHTAHYSDMPKEQFYKKVGLNSKIDKIESKEGEQSWQSKLPRNLLAGFSEMGQNALDVPSNFAKAMEKRYGQNTLAGKLGLKAQDIPRQDYNYPEMLGLPKNPTTADKLIRGLAGQVPALLAPELKLGRVGEALKSIPFAGRFAKKAIGTAIPVGGFEATQNQENPLEAGAKGGATTIPFSLASSIATSMNPYARVAGRLGLTGLGAYGGYEGAKAIGANSLLAEIPAAAAGAALGMVGRNPKVEARESMLKGVSETSYKEKLEAAQRLGLKYLTPAEASGNPFVAAQQGAAGKTEAGSQMLYKQGNERLSSEKEAINKLYKTVYDENKHDAELSGLYKQAYEKEVPEELLTNLKENEIFKTAEKEVQNKPAFKESLKDVPKNSIAYLDHVKRSLDDMIEAAPKQEARILKKTQSDLMSKMDKIAPEYKQARALAERKITLQEELIQPLNEANQRGTSFFNKILKNDQKFKKLRHSLRNVPDAQQNLDDMRLVFGDLINPPTVRTAAGLANTGMRQERNSRIAFANYMKDKLSGGKFDKAAIELITNPKWADELHKVAQVGKFRKGAGKIIDLLGRVSGASVASKVPNKPTVLELDKFKGYE